MDGYKRLVFRLTPIIMLICFICIGITHAFQQEGQPNITYLTSQEIIVDNNDTPNDLTDDTKIQNYEFDFQAYRQNIENINILKRSINHTVDIDAYNNTVDRFTKIWEDGYQVTDVTKTIANAILLVINTLIIPINIVLVPVRIISGILLTGITLMGVRIDRNTPIVNTLNGIVDKLAIPLINSTWPQNGNIDNSIWQFNQKIETEYAQQTFAFVTVNIPLNYTTNTGGVFKRIFTTVYDVEIDGFGNYKAKTKLYYVDTDNNEILVCDNGIWYYNVQEINITDTSNLTKKQLNLTNYFLTLNATRIG